MASTNKTPRLGLSQWVLSDPFRMEDFNQDNAKIDDGFKAVDQRFTEVRDAMAPLALVQLGEVVTSQSCQQIDLDVSGIEWDRYLQVSLYWEIKCSHLASDYASCNVFANNRSAATDYRVRYLANSDNKSSDSNGLYFANVRLSETGGGARYFETRLHPQFDAAVFYTDERSFNGDASYTRGAILKTSASDATPLPLSSLKSLHFNCVNCDTARQTLTMQPGCKFLIYGVRK